jgi:hypothetical protein
MSTIGCWQQRYRDERVGSFNRTRSAASQHQREGISGEIAASSKCDVFALTRFQVQNRFALVLELP